MASFMALLSFMTHLSSQLQDGQIGGNKTVTLKHSFLGRSGRHDDEETMTRHTNKEPGKGNDQPKEYEYFPVSDLIYDREANTLLHQFLLKESQWERTTFIKVGDQEYEVGVISVDTAPTIPHTQH